MPFALTNDPSQSEISEAINYLLANFGPNLSADPNNGQISGPSGDIIGYLYKYIAVKYADSFDGSVNFSDSPTNRLYYGLRNSNDSNESTNYADYIWYRVADGGFGTTKFLYYIVTGGRSIQFQIATSTPNPGWVLDTSVSIDLDVTTSAKSVANFVIIRIPNNSGIPTDAECLAAIGRTPISGDLCTVNYNNGIYSITYKYTTGWAIFQKYITGDLIVANSIVASNIAANTITAAQIASNTITAGQIASNTITAGQIASNTITAGQIAANTITSAQIAANSITASSIDSRNLTIKDSSGNIIFGSGASVNASSYLVAPGGWLNSNISINANGTLSGGGGGQVNLGGLGAGGFAYLNQITSANATTYIAGAAIGTAQVGILTANNIGANTIDASKIAANTITAGQIAANGVTATNIDSRNLTIKDASGNVIFGSGASVNASSYLVPSGGWLNSNISIGSNGVLSGAGGGTVTATGINAVATDLSNAPAGILNSNVSLGTLGAGAFAYLNAITSSNVTTYISGAAIGTAQIGVLTAGNIGANTIDASKIAANTITAGQIAANSITADRLSVSNLSAITANLGTITAGSISGTSLSVGSSPAVSGTSMTGAGAVINTDGTFALGNGSTNISYDGSQMSINGNVVTTANINANSVTATAGFSYPTTTTITLSFATWTTLLSVSIDSSSYPVWVNSIMNGYFEPISGGAYYMRLLDGYGTEVNTWYSGYIGAGDTPSLNVNLSNYLTYTPSGSVTYYVQVYATNTGQDITLYQNSNIFTIATKR